MPSKLPNPVSHRHSAALLLGVSSLLVACGDTTSKMLPDELNLSNQIFRIDDLHSNGPGGQSEALTIYLMSDPVAARLADGGLSYLGSLPSTVRYQAQSSRPNVSEITYGEGDDKQSQTISGPWTAPFTNWQSGPVPLDAKWHRWGRTTHDKQASPIVSSFHDTDFVATISESYLADIEAAQLSQNNLFAYSGYREQTLLLLDLDTKRAYHFYRD